MNYRDNTEDNGHFAEPSSERDDLVSRNILFYSPEVKVIREQLGVSQEKFALLLGVSKRTVENWEQGRRYPTGAARSLLKIVEADPFHALRALSA